MSVQDFKSAITVVKWVKISGMQEDGCENLKANRYSESNNYFNVT